MYYPTTHLMFTSEQKRIGGALIASLFLHICFLSTLLPHPNSISLPKNQYIEITLEKSKPSEQESRLKKLPVKSEDIPEKINRQIVTPSSAPKIKPKVETNLRSERDSATEKESIKRGTGGKINPVQQSANKNLAESPVEKNSKPNLRLSEESLQRNFAEQSDTPSPDRLARLNNTQKSTQKGQKPSDEQRADKFRNQQPFEKDIADLFIGSGGTSDYLPQIRDGQITLLNAKADQHAVFVRRVALQVFGILRRLSWREIPYQETRKIKDFVKIDAAMSKSGKLIKIRVLESSGSQMFDRIVESAVSEGTWDQNPPSAAIATDGTIHFVFEARTWARGLGDGRSEQRWLLLGTGLL